MDFGTLDLGPAAASRTETTVGIQPKGADGQPVIMKNGETLQVTMLLPGTPEGQREVRKWGLVTGVQKPLEKPGEASEEDLDAEAARQISSEVEMVARLVREWNLIDNQGDSVSCSLENRRGFFAHFAALRADVLVQMNHQMAVLGNAPSA